MNSEQTQQYIASLGKQFYAATPDRKMELLSGWSEYLSPEIINGVKNYAAQLDNTKHNLDYLTPLEQKNFAATLEPVQFNPITNQYQKFNLLGK